MMLCPMYAWLAWIGCGGGRELAWPGRVGGPHPTAPPVHRLQWAGEVRGNILTLPPLPLHIYNSRFQGYASELVFNQKNENVNKEEE